MSLQKCILTYDDLKNFYCSSPRHGKGALLEEWGPNYIEFNLYRHDKGGPIPSEPIFSCRTAQSAKCSFFAVTLNSTRGSGDILTLMAEPRGTYADHFETSVLLQRKLEPAKPKKPYKRVWRVV